MSEKVARFLSVLLHPAWMPGLAFVLLINTSSFFQLVVPEQMITAVYFIVILTTILIPLFLVNFLYHKGYIRSYEMNDRAERNIPYLISIAGMLLAFYMLNELQAPFLFGRIMLGAATAMGFTYLINLKWKISLHMIGMGGLCGVFFAVSELLYENNITLLSGALLVSGLLGTARIRLGAHYPSQIYAGFFLGFVAEYFLLAG
jgi:membrane-associated phospholipid phosphatase